MLWNRLRCGPSSGEVLIVEDTPASLQLLSDLLTQAGYSVRQAQDGEMALLSAQERPPELVLLDIRMPGINGYEVCRQTQGRPPYPRCPGDFPFRAA